MPLEKVSHVVSHPTHKQAALAIELEIQRIKASLHHMLISFGSDIRQYLSSHLHKLCPLKFPSLTEKKRNASAFSLSPTGVFYRNKPSFQAWKLPSKPSIFPSFHLDFSAKTIPPNRGKTPFVHRFPRTRLTILFPVLRPSTRPSSRHLLRRSPPIIWWDFQKKKGMRNKAPGRPSGKLT